MDYQKNLPVPNKTTNDIYYKRQLTCNVINVHLLASKESFFYCYDETVAKKAADDVCSCLFDFFGEKLDSGVKTLEIFWAGQNKNYIMIRFLH